LIVVGLVASHLPMYIGDPSPSLPTSTSIDLSISLENGTQKIPGKLKIISVGILGSADLTFHCKIFFILLQMCLKLATC
jgi:hypothetical protein